MENNIVKLKKKLVGFIGGIFNTFFDLYTGGKNRPIFFNIQNTYPQLLLLDNNYTTIKKEYENITNNFTLTEYHLLDKFQYKISGVVQPKKKWKVFLINSSGKFSETAQKYCPEICKTLTKIPDLFQVFISVLEPSKSIPTHKGPYRGYIRYHLTLKAPDKNAPYIRVKDKFHAWKEKKSILFDDSFDHEVVNQSSEERAVLIVDVLRPLPTFPTKVNRWIMNHLIAPTYGKKLLQKQTYAISKRF